MQELRAKLSDSLYYNVLLSSAIPYYIGGYDTCDLYHSVWNTPNTEILVLNGFPNLRLEDAIESGTIPMYNCIALTVGVNNSFIFPNSADNAIEWFDKLYNNEEVHTQFGRFKRPSGSLKYTRNGATEENSVVDIWGKEQDGMVYYTHGSIRKNSDGAPHGYDWESKLGDGLKIFHPRYALEGPAYGKVLAYYRVDDNQAEFSNLQRSVKTCDTEIVVENAVLTSEEKQQLDDLVSNGKQHIGDKFELLYSKCQSYITSYHYESNVSNLAKSLEYNEFLQFVKSDTEAIWLLFDKFVKGDYLAAIPIKDAALLFGDERTILWNDIMDAPLVGNIIRTSWTNIILFIKVMLKEDNSLENKKRRTCNENNIDIITDLLQVKVIMDIKEASAYAVYITNLKTNNLYYASPERSVQSGIYSCQYSLPSGLYLVTCILDGKTKSEKILIP